MLPIYELAARQHGLLTREQAHALGIAPRTLSRQIAEGRWTCPTRRVLAVPGVEQSLLTQARIAGLMYPGAIVAGPAAVAVNAITWLPDLPPEVWLIRAPASHRGYRCLGHPKPLRRVIDDVVVTNRRQTQLDLMRCLPWKLAVEVAGQALWHGSVTLPILAAEIAALRGRNGVGQLRKVHARFSRGSKHESENRLHRLLRAAGITGYRRNVTGSLPGLGVAELDFVFDQHRLVIEVDGWAFHSAQSDFQRDRRKQNAIVTLGYRILRYTWLDLTERPLEVIAEISQHLRLAIA